ncbi:MAG TPA: FdtA/QdtA family cupin domain-containing protein [Chitinophagales bacterium]|nr:FdtA/QdtA family cupin domain-containing protein [Chitinophagales bacterium]
MAKLIELKSFSDKRGSLSVLEDFQIPFTIKRFFYIYDVDDSVRGGHRHQNTFQAAICIKGACKIYTNNGRGECLVFDLNTPARCLLLEPTDWHQMFDFTRGAILLVAASSNFDVNDYVFDKYEEDIV